MKPLFIICFISVLLAACSKENAELEKPLDTTPHPQMSHIDLKDTAIAFGKSARFDLNKDGQYDIYFTTYHIGDPITKQDKKQWAVASSFYTNLPVNDDERIPVLRYNDSIPVSSFSGYHWYNASNVLLAQKVITESSTPFWEGSWKEASHRYIPFQTMQGEKRYNGWIEVSFSMASEKIIVHKAGIANETERTVKAGL